MIFKIINVLATSTLIILHITKTSSNNCLLCVIEMHSNLKLTALLSSRALRISDISLYQNVGPWCSSLSSASFCPLRTICCKPDLIMSSVTKPSATLWNWIDIYSNMINIQQFQLLICATSINYLYVITRKMRTITYVNKSPDTPFRHLGCWFGTNMERMFLYLLIICWRPVFHVSKNMIIQAINKP